MTQSLAAYLLMGVPFPAFIRQHIMIAALAFNGACVVVIVGLAVALVVTA